MWNIIAGPILSIIDKVIPDPQARDAAKLALVKMQQDGELEVMRAEVQLAMGQIEVNKVEAASDSFFRGGWRPAVGWVCVLGLLYTFIVQPLLAWGSLRYGNPVPPSLDMGELMTLLGGLLGLGGLRSFEKLKKVA